MCMCCCSFCSTGSVESTQVNSLPMYLCLWYVVQELVTLLLSLLLVLLLFHSSYYSYSASWSVQRSVGHWTTGRRRQLPRKSRPLSNWQLHQNLWRFSGLTSLARTFKLRTFHHTLRTWRTQKPSGAVFGHALTIIELKAFHGFHQMNPFGGDQISAFVPLI